MKILVERTWKKSAYTIGKLYVDNKFLCNTMEDKDRGLKQSMSISQIQALKVHGETAIPTGTYEVDMNTVSPKYSAKPWYVTNCNGAKLPRLKNVPGYAGVLIHPGNTAKDSEGCILVGKNDTVGMVTNSKTWFLKLYDMMIKAHKRGESIDITIR